jgi:hypothetical protein
VLLAPVELVQAMLSMFASAFQAVFGCSDLQLAPYRC